jgi:hypothetical protein
MAYAFTDSRIMPKQAIASIVSTTAAVPVGTIVRAKDTTLGEGEFIYLPTTASVTLGNIVSYRQNASGTYTAVRTPSGTGSGSSLAVAMATGQAACFGWFQIAGTAPVLKTAVIVSSNKPMYVSATAGRVKQIASTGRGILGWCRATPRRWPRPLPR